MKQLYIPLLLVFVVGCSHKPKKIAQNSKEKKSIVAAPVSSAESVAKNPLPKNVKPAKKELSEQDLLVELTGKKVSKQSEASLYMQIASAFQNRKSDVVRQKSKEFMIRFSKSSLMDNVLYVNGLSEMENSRYVEALRIFQRIEAEYPKGDRAAAARLSKALMYKRMNLKDQSQSNLQAVHKSYPGSPEAYRAQVELKIMK